MFGNDQRVFAPFRLDPANALLWRDDEQIVLRHKTFEVLRYLVDHPGQLVTKVEMLDAVWGKVAVGDTMPAICVAELRRALGDQAKMPQFIETVHRRGYRFIAPVTQATAMSPALRSQPLAPVPPLVGRDAEIAALRRHLDQSRRGAGGVVLIRGIAGIGKTRIAMELSLEAERAGIVTLVGHCYDREDPVPFVPFVEILEAALERTSSREISRALLGADAAEISLLLPQLRRLFPDIAPPKELAPAQSRRLLFNAVTGLFTRIAANCPLLLILEDLHWADEGTLSLLNHLARVVPTRSVMILGTYRDNELDRDGSLARNLEELIRLRLVEQINLGGLPRDAVAEIIRDFSGAAPPQPFVTLLHTVTEGNPFFLGELYRHLVERGLPLDRTDQLPTDLDLDGADLPQNLRLVLGQRLRRVSNETRKILGVAAVMGAPSHSTCSKQRRRLKGTRCSTMSRTRKGLD